MDTLKVQSQIRNNADEISNYLNDLMKWEAKIQHTDQAIRERKHKKAGTANKQADVLVRSTSKPSPDSSAVSSNESTTNPSSSAPAHKEASAAKHTYDVGYKKWEKINVDELLNDDEAEPSPTTEPSVNTPPLPPPITSDASMLTPASIIPSLPQVKAPVAAPRNARPVADMEAYERQRGNDAFEKGSFHQAVKHYTTCLGLKVGNYVAFSNRAMAYLRLKEYAKAEMDCNSALRIEKAHVKSYLRRATARNAIGKHRAAIADLQQVLHLEPNNKTAHQELKKSLDLLKTAASKAPLISLTPTWVGDADDDIGGAMAGPELPTQSEAVALAQQESVDGDVKSNDRPRRVSFDDTMEVIKVVNNAETETPSPDSLSAAVESPPTPEAAVSSSDTSSPLPSSKERPKKAKDVKVAKSTKAKKSKPKPSAAPSIGWYQVERGLLSYRSTPHLLPTFIKSLAIETLTASACWETGVIVELLQVVCTHYAAIGAADTALRWVNGMTQLPNFALLKTLWTNEEKTKLRELLASLESFIGTESCKDITIAYNV